MKPFKGWLPRVWSVINAFGGRHQAGAGSRVKFGRKPKLNHHQRQEAKARLLAGETQADVARSYGVDRSTICRLENV